MKQHILFKFPGEMKFELATFLDVTSINNFSQVSKNASSFFKDPKIWLNKIIKDFGIDKQYLYALPEQLKNDHLIFKNIYKHISQLLKHINAFPFFLQHYLDEKYYHELIKCCANDKNYFFQETPSIGHYNLLLLSIAAGAEQIVLALTEYIVDKQNVLSIAALAGDLKLSKALIDKFNLHPDEKVLNSASKSGDIILLKYFLDKKNNFGLCPTLTNLYNVAELGQLSLFKWLIKNYEIKPDAKILTFAAQSGNLEFVKYLIETFHFSPSSKDLIAAAGSGNQVLVTYFLKEKISVDEEVIYQAICSSNEKLVKFLLTYFHKFIFEDRHLDAAIKCGNHAMISLVLNYLEPLQDTFNKAFINGDDKVIDFLEKQHAYLPDKTTLDNAAQIGKLNLVKNLIQDYGLNPDQSTLEESAKSGNLALVNYLILNYSLKPTYHTLTFAIQSGNMDLIHYLLNPKNNFNIVTDRYHIVHVLSSNNLFRNEVKALLKNDKCLQEDSITNCHKTLIFQANTQYTSNYPRKS